MPWKTSTHPGILLATSEAPAKGLPINWLINSHYMLSHYIVKEPASATARLQEGAKLIISLLPLPLQGKG
jgi:hypothetical protein